MKKLLTLTLLLAGCSTLTPNESATLAQGKAIFIAIAKTAATAAAGYYGGPTGQAVASAIFTAAASPTPISSASLANVITAAGGEQKLASMASAQLAAASPKNAAASAFAINTIGAAVQSVANGAQ